MSVLGARKIRDGPATRLECVQELGATVRALVLKLMTIVGVSMDVVVA